MSFFSNLFGGKKSAPIAKPNEAIQKLRELEEMLEKKSEYLENKITEERAIVKKNGTKNKKVAIQALKRLKRNEKRLQELDGTLETINFQRTALEDASTNTSVLQAMKNASDALKGAHLDMNVDQVHDMMDDIAEQQDLAKELSEAISNPVAFEDDVDEDELTMELEKLEQEALDKELLNVDSTPELPEVPETKEPVTPARKSKAKSGKNGQDLKHLEAWAS